MSSEHLTTQALERDEIMRDLVKRFGPAPIGGRSPYVSLLRAIVSQQLSTHASRAIFERIEARYDVVDPAVLLRAREGTLRRTGLSATKARSFRAAARFAMDGGFEDLEGLAQDHVTERLTAIPGVGPWTAQMVMIFGMGFPDIWPVGDAGIQRAARLLYRVRSANGLVRLGSRFRPARSHAAWYLWRALDTA